MSVELSFPVSSSGDASVLARELRSDLIASGVPDRSIEFARGDPDNMDLGTILNLDVVAAVQIGLGAVSAVPVCQQIAQAIVAYVKRKRGVVKVKSDNATFVLNVDSTDVESLSEFLSKLAEKRDVSAR